MFGFSSVFHSTTGGGGGGGVGPTFKIFYKADENLCLTVRDGDAVLAPADSSDEYQHWFKDNRFGTYVHDEERKPAFSLINKATDLAVQPSGGPFRPVKLVRYDWDFFDNTLMWTLSNDLGNDFGFIRTLNDISLKLAAFPDDHGGVTVKLSDLSDGDNHLWKILPWSDNIMPGRAMRLYCKAGEGFSATVRNGTVCLAPTNPHDELQYWVEDMRYRDIIKDEDGYPAFALINRTTGYAIKRCEDKEGPVKLVPYDQHHLDLSVLWSKSDDMMHDFHYIRTIDYVYLNLDIYDKGDDDKMHSGVQDGAKVMLSYWRSNDDLQYWRVDPWEPEREHETSCGITYSRRRLKKRATA